jgi:uncharacterized protein YbjT (DUF2867 family)
MKTIFITGGTGYIGKRLIPLLQKEGYQIKALVRKVRNTNCHEVVR